MLFFPITIVDDFFPDPDAVLELAEKVDYDQPKKTNYPGVSSSKRLYEIDERLAQYTIKKMLSTYWDPDSHEFHWNVDSDFQKITPHKNPYLNKGLIHTDNIVGHLATAIVYLNKNDSYNAGTSFYYKKDGLESSLISSESINQSYIQQTNEFHETGVETERLTKEIENHRKHFEETMRVQAKYNRMVLFPSEMWHSQTTYGDETRYTVRCFVTDVLATVKPNKGMKARPPMLRYIN